MPLTIKVINPDLKGTLRCLECNNVMDIGDIQVCGDCMVCPICGEWERFEEVQL